MKNDKILGSDGRIIPSILWQNSETASEKLAIIFPGFAYPSDAPLTFYLKMLFIKYKYDVLSIDYRYNENEKYQNLNNEEKAVYFKKGQERIFDQIKSNYKEKKIVFIGKSLGTNAIYEIIQNNINDLLIKDSIYIWLTPAKKNMEIIDICQREKLKSFYIIGDHDQFYNGTILQNVQSDTFDILIIKDAGHAMETEDDLGLSIDNLKQVILWMEENIIMKRMGLL